MALAAGAATVSLAPPPGIAMGGYGGRKGVAAGVHDEISVRALVLVSGETRIGLVICDLVALDPATVDAFRALAARECDIPDDHLVVAVTHTHSGPIYGSFLTRYLTGLEATDAQRAQFAAWADELPRKLLAALQAARAQVRPARMLVGRASAQVAINRRLPDATGEIRLHPNPDGVTDPELLALRFVAADGAAIATVLNYACHPVVLCEDNLLHSADYPHFLRQQLEAEAGGVALFVNGACGDLNPLRRGDFAAAEWVGTTLATAAQRALVGAAASLDVPLAAAAVQVSLSLKPLPAESDATRYLAHARAARDGHSNPENYEGRRLAAEVQRAEEQALRLQAQRQRLSLWGARDGAIEAMVQALRIGDVSLVCLPGENFVELGTAIKAAAGGRPCLVIGYSNRSVGYVPTRPAYAAGGYEVNSSFLAPGAGEEMAAAAIRLMQGLQA